MTLTKAPTPWLQNKNKPQEELPEWAKRSSVIKQSSVESPTSPPVSSSSIQQPQSPQWQQTQQRQQPVQQRPQSLPQIQQRPVQIQQQSQQYQYQQPQGHQFNQQQKRPFSGPPVTQQANPQIQHQERVIPIRVSVYYYLKYSKISTFVAFYWK